MNPRQHTAALLLSLLTLAAALQTATAQIVRVDFTAETLSPLNGLPSGGIIQGRISVDLAQMPEDSDPGKLSTQHNYYTAEVGPFPGYTFEFDTGAETVRFDSINAAGTPGDLAPGIFTYDNTGARDWIAFQARSAGYGYAASLSFEDYTLTNGLITADYFPEAVNLAGGMERAIFYYGAIKARVTTATLTVDTGGIRTGLLQYRINRSDLPRYKKRILLNNLRLAETAFARKRCHIGLKHLLHFQRKLRLLIPRREAALAHILHHGAAQLIADGCDQTSK